MNEVEQVLTDQNVRNYIDLLAWEVDPKGRSIYSKLLRIEEDRYAHEVARLDVIDGWIKKCDRHIAQFKTLLGKSGLMDLRSSPQCQGLVQGMIETRSILISLRQTAMGRVNNSAEFIRRKPSSH